MFSRSLHNCCVRRLEFVLILLSLLGLGADAIAVDGHVHVLTESDFAKSVKSLPYTFVEFYAPWCGHCKKLEPEWEETAALAATHSIAVAKVNAISEEKLAQKYKVQSFPTLMLFKGHPDVVAKYNGPRDASRMADWLGKWNAGGLVTDLAPSESAVTSWAPDAKVKVLGLLSGGEDADKELRELLEQAAFSLNPSGPKLQLPVAVAPLPGGEIAKLGISDVSLPGIVLLREFEFEDKSVFYGDFEKGLQPLLDWVEQRKMPALMPANKETEQFFLQDVQPGHAIAILFGGTEDVVGKIHKLAVEMSSVPNLKWVHAKADDFGESLGKNVGMEVTGYPDFVIWQFGESEDDDRTFKLSTLLDDFSIEKVDVAARDFISTWQNGALVAEKDPVVAVTSDTFEQIVIEQPKDVLVEFYAPWCGHCQTLAPVYKEVASHYASDTGVEIAKVDATKHSHSSADIKSFPTLMFYPKLGKHRPIEFKFKANRDKRSIIDLIEEHRGGRGTSAPVKASPSPQKKDKKKKQEPMVPAKQGSFEDVPCPPDADIFACAAWCEASSSASLKLVGTLGGKACAERTPNDEPQDFTTCTCYDEDFTDAKMSCKPVCTNVAQAQAHDSAIDSIDDSGTCAANDPSCNAGSTGSKGIYDDDDIAADF